MRRTALASLLLLALTLAVACGDDGAAANLDSVDPSALLLAAADRTEAVTSFHFVLEHENGSTEIVRGLQMKRAEGDVIGSDRLRAEIEASLGPLNLEGSIVILEDKAWITNPLTNRWEREDLSIEELFDPASGVTALMRGVSAPQLLGTESVDGARSYRVEATVDSSAVQIFGPAPAGQMLEAAVWIGIDDSLVRRIEVRGALRAGEPDDLVRRVTLSQFNVEFEIVAPR
ncbi:MAG TPA: LppX_LprAFG lipoprotein [Dehalococcoidia bacterium]|nr:LppX_LprAFG lipoprotein [Dehalococcoidia bacterium]